MKPNERERCACGEPLHYTDPELYRYVEAQIARLGPTVPVRVLYGGSGYRVPRHYIALHGLKADELSSLARRYHWEFIE